MSSWSRCWCSEDIGRCRLRRLTKGICRWLRIGKWASGCGRVREGTGCCPECRWLTKRASRLCGLSKGRSPEGTWFCSQRRCLTKGACGWCGLAKRRRGRHHNRWLSKRRCGRLSRLTERGSTEGTRRGGRLSECVGAGSRRTEDIVHGLAWLFIGIGGLPSFGKEFARRRAYRCALLNNIEPVGVLLGPVFNILDSAIDVVECCPYLVLCHLP